MISKTAVLNFGAENVFDPAFEFTLIRTRSPSLNRLTAGGV